MRFHLAGDKIAKVCNTLIKYVAYAVIVYFVTRSVDVVARAWAGKTTLANVNVNVTGSVNASTAVGKEPGSGQGDPLVPFLPCLPDLWIAAGAIVLAAGTISYGKRQARLRKDTVEEMHKYQLEYERSLDPNRTSSNLTKRGDTRPGDE